MNPDLTFKQLRFAEEYVVDQNGTQAALRAGYSKASAAVSASRLLRNAKVRARITHHMARIGEEVDSRAIEAYQKLKNIAFQNIVDFWDEDEGSDFVFKPLDQLTDEERVRVKRVRMRGEEVLDITFENKVQALGQLLELGIAQRALNESSRNDPQVGVRDG